MPSSGDELRQLLEELEERLRSWGAPVIEAFRPGAPAAQVRAVLAGEGLGAPADLVTWFAWHDGASDPQGPRLVDLLHASLIDYWYVISLARAVEIRRWHRNEAIEVGEPELLLLESWFPVLHDVGSAFLCVDTAAGDAEPAPVYLVDWPGKPDSPPRPHFSSLAELVSLVVRLFDTGVVRPHPEDPRLPSLQGASLDAGARRLTAW